MVDPHCRVAVYPGSFDPITLGHLNVMERASTLFDRLIVGVGVNIEKEPMFDGDERMRLIREATAHLENVEIRTFYGLAVEFVRECGSRVMVRGVRPITDIPAELTMMMANRRLAPGHRNAVHDRRRRPGPRLQLADQADRPVGRRRRACTVSCPTPPPRPSARNWPSGSPSRMGRANHDPGGSRPRLNVTSSPTATQRQTGLRGPPSPRRPRPALPRLNTGRQAAHATRRHFPPRRPR